MSTKKLFDYNKAQDQLDEKQKKKSQKKNDKKHQQKQLKQQQQQQNNDCEHHQQEQQQQQLIKENLTIHSKEGNFKMAATRRLQKELADLKSSGLKSFRDIVVDEQNLLFWTGLIVPENPPYNKGAFRIEINFPAEYPFKPPKINFKTKIYHPNIDEKGQVCLPIISTENWKPATKTDQVIQALIALINDPEPEHPLRGDIAEEFLKDRKKFMKNAEDFTRKNSEKRPTD